MSKKVDYNTMAGRPLIIEVERDGVPYEILVGIAILSVEDTGNDNEKGIPIFTVKANLAVDTVKKT